MCGVELAPEYDRDSVCLMGLDFARESEIVLAPLFPIDSVAPGECIMSEKLQK